MTMRWITAILLALLVLVQADLWFSRNGMFHVRGLQGQLDDVRGQIDEAKARNEQVQAEVNDLREGLEMVEEKARAELGMVKRDEIYIQVSPRR
jgi:cell division protein FtsB